MLALSIRQPFAELILRGMKTIEYRSRPTRVIGERFYIYASLGGRMAGRPDGRTGGRTAAAGATLPQSAGVKSVDAGKAGAGADPLAGTIWSGDLRPAIVPPWMRELAEALRLFPHDLPRGAIVGSAVIEKVTPGDPALGSGGMYHWHLTGVRRLKTPRKPSGHPQPVWFRAF